MQETECPNCEALQKFIPRRRRLSAEISDVDEVYVVCTHCKTELKLGHTTTELEVALTTNRKLKVRAQWVRDRHGIYDNNLDGALRRSQNRVNQLNKALWHKLNEAGIETPTD